MREADDEMTGKERNLGSKLSVVNFGEADLGRHRELGGRIPQDDDLRGNKRQVLKEILSAHSSRASSCMGW